MTLYGRGILTMAAIMGAGLSFGILAIHRSAWFMVPFFGVVFGAHLITDRLMCPKCGHPVLNPPPGSLWPKSLFQAHCANCGHDLNDGTDVEQRGR